MDPIALIFMMLLLLGASAILVFSPRKRAAERWAEANGLTLIKARRRHLLQGPFTLNTTGIDVVFRIEVSDPQRGPRSGWLLVRGLPLKGSQVRWDDEPERFTDYPHDFPGGR